MKPRGGIATQDMVRLADRLKLHAATGIWDGGRPTAYFWRSRADHMATGSCLLFTRDVGHHTSGWWKNPEYERCWHLSISYFDPTTEDRQPAQHDHALSALWCQLFFGERTRMLWAEPPYSDEGKARETWHFRLFADPAWQPIVPRGEVYTRAFTEAGWLSFSDLQDRLRREREQAAREGAHV